MAERQSAIFNKLSYWTYKNIIDNNEIHKLKFGDKYVVHYLNRLGFSSNDYSYKIREFYAKRESDSNNYSNFIEFEFIEIENTQSKPSNSMGYRGNDGSWRYPK